MLKPSCLAAGDFSSTSVDIPTCKKLCGFQDGISAMDKPLVTFQAG